jgi:hypothetical protein
MTDFHLEVLNDAAVALLARLRDAAGLTAFHVGGGTAAVLYAGHRCASEVELHSHAAWDWWTVASALEAFGAVDSADGEHRRLLASVGDVTITTRDRPFPIRDALEYVGFGPPLSSPLDALAEVLLAIREGGSRDDYADVFHLCRQGLTVAEGLDALGEGAHRSSIVVGLTVFDRADATPGSRLLIATEWPTVKRFCAGQAAALGG